MNPDFGSLGKMISYVKNVVKNKMLKWGSFGAHCTTYLSLIDALVKTKVIIFFLPFLSVERSEIYSFIRLRIFYRFCFPTNQCHRRPNERMNTCSGTEERRRTDSCQLTYDAVYFYACLIFYMFGDARFTDISDIQAG